MTDARVSQAGLAVAVEWLPDARVSQAGLVVAAAIQPDVFVSQAGLVVVASAAPCSSRRCQLWSIERRDGVTLRFTSHDVDVIFGASTYITCGSLNETASEQSSDANQVGNVELTGLLSSEHIAEDDCMAGLYDDAFVQVWRVSWDDDTDTVQRIAAGWTGAVSNGEQGFKTEVLGPGARVLQKALLDKVTPGCRFRFGDPDTCGFDLESAAVFGATVVSAISRSLFTASISGPGGVAQFARGTVRWTGGRNAGIECEVTSVDFGSGIVILAISAGFVPEAGDSFDLLPGCDLSAAQCKLYDRYLNYGGFEFVPGGDATAQVPIAKV